MKASTISATCAPLNPDFCSSACSAAVIACSLTHSVGAACNDTCDGPAATGPDNQPSQRETDAIAAKAKKYKFYITYEPRFEPKLFADDLPASLTAAKSFLEKQDRWR
jgi:hypothetical protein